MNLRAVTWLLGALCMLLAAALLVPAGVSAWYGEPRAVAGFLASAAVAAVAGTGSVALGRGALRSVEGRPAFFRREGMVVVAVGWLLASLIGALPFVLSGETGSFADALFESVSGFTTTGSSVFTGDTIDGLSRGVNFWRCFSQWLGGIGIVLIFVAVLPVGGRSLFRSEGIDRQAEEARVRDSAFTLLKAYATLTAVCVALLASAGMGAFDSVAHAFSCLSTGGFSTRGASLGYYESPLVEAVCIAFMIVGGTNFALWTVLYRKGPRAAVAWARTSSELRLYALLLIALPVGLTVVLWFWGGSNGRAESDLPEYQRFLLAFRDAAFASVSVQTTTGLATADFDRWPDVCRVALMLTAVVGSCAGSTGGGIKAQRAVILGKAAIAGVRSYGRPRAVVPVRMDAAALDDASVLAAMRFVALYVLVALGGVLLLCLFGEGATEAITGVIACLNTMGPGLGGLGPSQSFGALGDASKLVLCGLMILGRLELYALVAMCLPGFWRS